MKDKVSDIPFHSNIDSNTPNNTPWGIPMLNFNFYLELAGGKILLLAVLQLYLKGSQDLSRYQLDRWSRYKDILHLFFFFSPRGLYNQMVSLGCKAYSAFDYWGSQGVLKALFVLPPLR